MSIIANQNQREEISTDTNSQSNKSNKISTLLVIYFGWSVPNIKERPKNENVLNQEINSTKTGFWQMVSPSLYLFMSNQIQNPIQI